MSLPLEQIAAEDGLLFLLTPKRGASRPAGPSPALLPLSPPAPGEQYRFHFDMTKCIGCRCCEVACNEQNNNPADIRWRRVGEVEGGSYPFTQRLYLSMGCNHCLEPSCLQGCPVDAYTKDSLTGLVLHSAEMCIGCQYCTWNCSYGVPQYNPERGVVGKCDMCYGRLAQGHEPACVNACPESAIRIETVNVAEWLEQYQDAANAPGLPAADHTISTTRITLPSGVPAELQKADSHRVRPESAHWPLVLMTVLTQVSVGAFIALLGDAGRMANTKLAALAALAIAFVSLAASTLHLGRPAYAWRALKMWRRSWLSREVLLFSCFAIAACLYAGAQLVDSRLASFAGALTALFGAAGIAASAFIYLVPARPAWNSRHTIADFYLTAALAGPLFLSAFGEPLTVAAMAAGAAQLLNQALKFLWLIRSDEFELRASARLLSSQLARPWILRFALLLLGGIVLPAFGMSKLAFALAIGGEILGRYLFFTSVVPRNMAASFSEIGRLAA